MIEMCKTITPYVCKDCGNELLFFVTKRNTLVDYKTLFKNGTTSQELYQKLNNLDVRYLKCMVCNKLYIIDWSDHFPQQLVNKNNLSKFGV